MRRFVVLVLTVAAVIALVGCGGSGRSALAVVAAAPEAAEEAGSARFEMDMTMSSESLPGGQMKMRGTGAVRFRDQQMHMTMRMSGGPGASGEIETVLDGSVVYLRQEMLAGQLPGGKSWIRMDLETLGEEMGIDVAQLMQAGQTDPTAVLETLRGAADDLEELGTEEIRGVQTTHYRVSVNADKALEVYEGDTEQLKAFLEQAGMPDRYPMDVWIGDDGLARRMSLDLETTPEGIGSMQQSMAMELFDYGADVDVQVPAEDDTIDLQQLMQQGGGSR